MIGQRAFVQVGLTYQLTDMKYSDYLNRLASINNRYSGLYPNVQLQYMLNPQKQSGISIAYAETIRCLIMATIALWLSIKTRSCIA